ncbi:MAG: aldo/keto reductase [Alphaproteobacteria bacterium]|nr:aldo/keto reductase [Alphaproteobacteria bacterium]
MQEIRFGATGLWVSRAAVGTMTFGDRMDEKASHAAMDLARSVGVDMLDTANVYNAGRSEEIVGTWLKKAGGRDRITLISKVRQAVGGDFATAGLSPKIVVREVEASLRRLQTDYLDILFLHMPDDDTPIEVTLQCVDGLVRAGKVRYLGLSNYAAWQVVEAIHVARANSWAQPLLQQVMYNPVARGLDQEFLPMARRYDLGICAYNPLAGGLLTDKHGSAAASGSRLATNQQYISRYWNEATRKAAAAVSAIARAGGRTVVELALRFVLDTPQVQVALIGGTRIEHFADNFKACGAKPLTADERAQLDAVWAELRGPIPRYNRSNEDAKRPAK